MMNTIGKLAITPVADGPSAGLHCPIHLQRLPRYQYAANEDSCIQYRRRDGSPLNATDEQREDQPRNDWRDKRSKARPPRCKPRIGRKENNRRGIGGKAAQRAS